MTFRSCPFLSDGITACSFLYPTHSGVGLQTDNLSMMRFCTRGWRMHIYATVYPSFPVSNVWTIVWITDVGKTKTCPGKA